MRRLAIIAVLTSSCVAAQSVLDQQKQEARRLFANTEIEQSIAEWQTALKTAPSDVDCLLGIGVAEDALGQYADAEQYLVRAERIAPRSATVLNDLAINSLHLGKKEEAIRLFRRSLDLDAVNQNALYNLGSLYVEAFNWTSAEPLFARLYSVRRDDSEVRAKLVTVYLHLAQLDLRAGKSERSLSEYQRLMDLAPDQPDGYIGAALVLAQSDSILTARQLLDEAERRFPQDLRVLLERGYVQQLARDETGAVETYSRAVKLSPESFLAYAFLGRAYREVGKLEESEKALLRAAEIAPSAALPKYELAQTLLQIRPGDGEISNLLLEAIHLDPSRSEPSYLLGKLALQAGDVQRAEKLLEQSEKADPSSAPVHYLLAQVYRRLGREKEAKDQGTEYQRLKDHHATHDLTFFH